MKAGTIIYAKTHADFFNQLLNKNFKSYMKCTYDLNSKYSIWLIRLSNRESKLGWTNTITNSGNTINEFYTGNPKNRLEYQKNLNPDIRRLVFDILDSASGIRRYIFKGVFKYDISSNNVYRVWNKVADEYRF